MIQNALPLLDNSAYISRMILPPRDACTITADLVGREMCEAKYGAYHWISVLAYKLGA